MLEIFFPGCIAENILTGQKTQAIIDENPMISVGDTVRFHPSDKSTTTLDDPVCGACTRVLPILILPLRCEIYLDDELLPRDQWAKFAHDEGYQAIAELFLYFCKYDVFRGQLISWELTQQLPEAA
jgi:hypothetical protein